MLRSKNIVALATLALAVGLSFSGASVRAESACKGLELGQCQKKDACSWIEAYTRKDGVEVSGHCKSKPRKSAKSEDKKQSEGEKATLENRTVKTDTEKGTSETKKVKSDTKKKSESKKAKSDTKKAKSDTKKKSESKKAKSDTKKAKSERKKDKKE